MSWEEEEMSGSLGTFGMECVQHQLGMMSPVENFIREWAFLPFLPGAAVASDQIKQKQMMSPGGVSQPLPPLRKSSGGTMPHLPLHREQKEAINTWFFRCQHWWFSARPQGAVIPVPRGSEHCWAPSRTMTDAATLFLSRWAPLAAGYKLAVKNQTSD